MIPNSIYFLASSSRDGMGPFIVQQAHPNGSVDILNPIDNRVIKVNGQRVKPYVVQQTVVKEEILLLDPP